MRLLVFILLAIASAPVAFAAAANQVPAFDIERSCSFEADMTTQVQQAKARCKQDETKAKKELTRRWPQLGAHPKRRCIAESTTGDDQSYVELLTCVQMSTDWKQQGTQTVGQTQSKKRRH